MRFQFCTSWFRFDLRKNLKSLTCISGMLTNSQTPDEPVLVPFSVFNRIWLVLSRVVYTLSIYPVTVKLIGICQLLVENVTPQFFVLNTITSSCMLFTHLSDWYPGWAIFNVWVHDFLITAVDPIHSTGTDVVIGISISTPSNTSYAFFSDFAKKYVFIMSKMSK